LVQKLVITCHTTYTKISYGGLMDLRYHTSRFFTFLFFMSNISGNSLYKFNKSCSVLHQESNKIGFSFFQFFYDFLEILQKSGNCTIEDVLFHRGPYKELRHYNHALSLRKNPRKDLGACNVALGHGGGAARPNPARPAILPAVWGHMEEGKLT
jgi:hypothetical protein